MTKELQQKPSMIEDVMHKDKPPVFNTPPYRKLEDCKGSMNSLVAKIVHRVCYANKVKYFRGIPCLSKTPIAWQCNWHETIYFPSRKCGKKIKIKDQIVPQE